MSSSKGEVIVRRGGRAELCSLLGVAPVTVGRSSHYPAELKQAMRCLPPLQREVLDLRFGSGDGFSLSLIRTVRAMRSTRAEVLSLEAKALLALKSALSRQLISAKLSA